MNKIVFLLILFTLTPIQAFEWEVHGNYCGPGYFGDNFTLSPISVTDVACKLHDLCYADKGRDDCECDRILWQRVSSIKRYCPENNSLNLPCRKNIAHLIDGAFSTKPCKHQKMVSGKSITIWIIPVNRIVEPYSYFNEDEYFKCLQGECAW